MRGGRRRSALVFLVLAALQPVPTLADFLLAAGNWTRNTNMFETYHFVPGYNEAGEWDVLTGGNCALGPRLGEDVPSQAGPTRAPPRS